MAYRNGYCPQCGVQILVQNNQGQWASMKSNYRQGTLIYSNGHRCKTIICADCLASPDLKKLQEEITCEASTASSRDVLDYLKTLGDPIAITEVQ